MMDVKIERAATNWENRLARTPPLQGARRVTPQDVRRVLKSVSGVMGGYTPAEYRALCKMARNRKAIALSLRNLSKEIEAGLLSTWRTFASRREAIASDLPDLNELPLKLQILASYLAPLPTDPERQKSFANWLGELRTPRGVPPNRETAKRDFTIWGVVDLFKRRLGAPHYGLVADIMNKEFELSLSDDDIKKSIKRPFVRPC